MSTISVEKNCAVGLDNDLRQKVASTFSLISKIKVQLLRYLKARVGSRDDNESLEPTP